jgi:hypothetical protein
MIAIVMVIVIAMKSFRIALVGGAIVALVTAFDERTTPSPSRGAFGAASGGRNAFGQPSARAGGAFGKPDVTPYKLGDWEKAVAEGSAFANAPRPSGAFDKNGYPNPNPNKPSPRKAGGWEKVGFGESARPGANADRKGVKRGGGDGWEVSDRWGAAKRLKPWNVPSDGDAYASKQDSGNDNFRKFGKFGVDKNKNVENFGYWDGPRQRFGGVGSKTVPRSPGTLGRQGIIRGEGDPHYTPEKMAEDLKGAKAKGNGIFVPPELERRFKGRGGDRSDNGNVGGRV